MWRIILLCLSNDPTQCMEEKAFVNASTISECLSGAFMEAERVSADAMAAQAAAGVPDDGTYYIAKNVTCQDDTTEEVIVEDEDAYEDAEIVMQEGAD